MKTQLPVVLLVGMFLGSACVASPEVVSGATPPDQPAPAQGEGQSQGPEASWPVYANDEAGFSIRYPSDWQVEPLPDENAGQLHRVLLSGPEGGVQLDWGTGLGGACPEGYQPVQAAQGEFPACHSRLADGTEQWSLAGKQLGPISFAAMAYTSDAAASSRELVLQILSTLSFP